MLCFDVETHLIVPGNLTPKLVCVSYARSTGDVRLALAEEGTDVVEGALDAGEVIVGHNLVFDFAVCAAFRPRLLPKIFDAYAEGRVRDTQIRQQLIDIADGCLNFPRADGTRGYKLLNLEQHWLGKDRTVEKLDPSAWRMRYAELDGVPLAMWPQAAIDYAKDDAQGTLEVYLAQLDRPASELGPTVGRLAINASLVNEIEQVAAAWCLHLCSVWGLRTNKAAVDDLEADCRQRFTQLQHKMLVEGLIELRPATKKEVEEGKVDAWTAENKPVRYKRNMAAIRERVTLAYQTVGEQVPHTDPTKTAPAGNIKTDADTLKYSGDEVLEELGEGGPITTILKTFVPSLKRGTEVAINARFNCLVDTGRPSCSDPNLYNIPRAGGVRECIEARPGYVLCSVDYDCAELRGLAQVCLWLFGKSALAEFFQKDPAGDPHLELAAWVLGVEPSEAKRRMKLPCGQAFIERLGKGVCLHCEVKDMRQMCKAFNFGFPGGMGIDTMMRTARKQYGVILSREKALEGRQAWLNRWPEIREYFKHINALVGMGEATVTQLRPGMGPHRRRGGLNYKQACNGYFQGLIADAFKHALWLVTKEAYLDETSPLFGTRPVVPLYDEIIAEIPERSEGAAHEAAYRMAEVQRLGAQEWLPDVPVTCSPALSYRWSKDAKEKFNAEGRLVAWDGPRVRAAA